MPVVVGISFVTSLIEISLSLDTWKDFLKKKVAWEFFFGDFYFSKILSEAFFGMKFLACYKIRFLLLDGVMRLPIF